MVLGRALQCLHMQYRIHSRQSLLAAHAGTDKTQRHKACRNTHTKGSRSLQMDPRFRFKGSCKCIHSGMTVTHSRSHAVEHKQEPFGDAK